MGAGAGAAALAFSKKESSTKVHINPMAASMVDNAVLSSAITHNTQKNTNKLEACTAVLAVALQATRVCLQSIWLVAGLFAIMRS